MVIETFVCGSEPVYARAAEQGRMLPEGLEYVDSWVSEDLGRCWQLMETDDRALLDEWIARWDDLVESRSCPFGRRQKRREPPLTSRRRDQLADDDVHHRPTSRSGYPAIDFLSRRQRFGR
jgi:Domain of unknown function (DUF3303)